MTSLNGICGRARINNESNYFFVSKLMNMPWRRFLVIAGMDVSSAVKLNRVYIVDTCRRVFRFDMKKSVLVTFVLVLLLQMTVFVYASAPVKAEPRVIYVDAKNTGFGDGSNEHPYSTIKEGTNAATSGDTVFVYNGTYQEWNITLDKDNLSLIGENRNVTIIDGGSVYYWILIMTAQNVTVTGFTIKNSPVGTAGIFLDHAMKSKISNNIIKNHDSGIYSAFSNYNLIENNWISDTYAGIILSSVCRENRISNNDVRGNTRGIDLSHGAHGNEIENNNIVQNKYGVSISFENNSIVGNQVVNNEVGIYEDSESTNGYRIFHNNFIENTKQIDSGNNSSNIWDDGYPSGGNYWSDYKNRFPNATELDGSGIWDTPYVLDENNQDNYPLMNNWITPSLPDTTSPTISVVTPENKTYTVDDVSLTFAVSESTSWIGYSLDGQANVTITGNTPLNGLSDGSHSLIVYAKDTAGNTGTSETIYFSIKTKKVQPFPTLIVTAIAIIAAIGAALLIYFTKVKKTIGKAEK